MEPSPATLRGTHHADLAPTIGAMLATPQAHLGSNGGSQPPAKRKAGGHTPTLADQVEHELLPTPAARDGKGRDMPGREGGKSLPETLLPTPRTADGMHSTMEANRERMAQHDSAGTRAWRGTIEEAVSLLPTPTAADGERASDTYCRGNPTLKGALLPTPQAKDSHKGKTPGQQAMAERGRGPDLNDVTELLPTPRATDGTKGGPGQRGSSGDLMLPSAVMELLPTPLAEDGHHASRGSSVRRAAKRQAEGRQLTVEETVTLLPTPSSADGLGGHRTRSGARSGEPLLGGISQLLPTPAAHDSGNSPQEHLGKKPGRQRVTSLQVIADHGLIESGGLLPTPTAADSRNSRNSTAGRSPGSAGHSGTTLPDAVRTGVPTGRRSRAGKRSSADPRHTQLTLDELDSDSPPDS